MIFNLLEEPIPKESNLPPDHQSGCIHTRHALCRGIGSSNKLIGDPNGIRTRVIAVKGQCPRPLDDGANNSGSACGIRTHFIPE